MDSLPASGALRPSAVQFAETFYKTPALVRHRVRCGKPTCHCAAGEGHGPYWFLHWREGNVQCRRYVRAGEVEAVRAVLARRRDERAAERLEDLSTRELLRRLKALEAEFANELRGGQ